MISRRSFLQAAAGTRAARRRPNIVFVLVDDLRWDELACTGHPFASTPNADRLAREGALFRNAFSVAPLCSPSRASFLTGQYPHRHGIVDNTDRAQQSRALVTWPRLLHDAGYATGFFGKWHMGNDDSPRPGFDRWVSFPGQGECFDPVLNTDGKRERTKGYITDLLTERAVQFLREQEARQPFCVYLSHKAIHPNVVQRDDGSIVGNIADPDAFLPAPRHKDLYAGMRLPHRPNYQKPPVDKPALARTIDGLPPLGRETATSDRAILNRMRMMKSVDEGLGTILQTLTEMNALDDTMVVLTSDHGYFYGEHGLDAERRLAYEESIRIPLLIRYPRRIAARTKHDQFVLNIDIAPTMLELAGVKSSQAFDGHSLMRRRDDFLIEYFSDTVFPRIRNMGYRAVRTQRWKYIEYRELEGMNELYDLQRDPYELHNRAGDAGMAPVIASLRRRIRVLT